MISDKLGVQLHHRAALGEQLSADEIAQLNTWYAALDRAEQADFSHDDDMLGISALQTEINSVLLRLEMRIEQVRRIAKENEQLRSEISNLRQQVAIQLEVA